MRLNNRNRVGSYNFLGGVISAIFLVGCAAFVLELFKFDVLGKWATALLIIVPSILALIFYLRGRQIFEYDSDGEAIHFKNRNIFFFSNPLNDEFPKYKVLNFEIVDAFILKRLFVTISSKKNHPIILKYDISYLNKHELKDLKISLNKVIKTNQEIRSAE